MQVLNDVDSFTKSEHDNYDDQFSPKTQTTTHDRTRPICSTLGQEIIQNNSRALLSRFDSKNKFITSPRQIKHQSSRQVYATIKSMANQTITDMPLRSLRYNTQRKLKPFGADS